MARFLSLWKCVCCYGVPSFGDYWLDFLPNIYHNIRLTAESVGNLLWTSPCLFNLPMNSWHIFYDFLCCFVLCIVLWAIWSTWSDSLINEAATYYIYLVWVYALGVHTGTGKRWQVVAAIPKPSIIIIFSSKIYGKKNYISIFLMWYSVFAPENMYKLWI